eukprot:CAMPEP_0201589962 /NCGR_PEP_ID=MMETSP0190_2-20130828/172638_1 /ASSEMBLY_ACC=CAM_ASM_000263 /TAXON_ID=37353 /ORGANISM="Rosalina sp." /LENGTH=68 /DNA_ID=CAMNT_0048045149 /DNA_START=268 /DNA_END=474 /DNA_ORIENTATION=+
MVIDQLNELDIDQIQHIAKDLQVDGDAVETEQTKTKTETEMSVGGAAHATSHIQLSIDTITANDLDFA